MLKDQTCSVVLVVGLKNMQMFAEKKCNSCFFKSKRLWLIGSLIFTLSASSALAFPPFTESEINRTKSFRGIFAKGSYRNIGVRSYLEKIKEIFSLELGNSTNVFDNIIYEAKNLVTEIGDNEIIEEAVTQAEAVYNQGVNFSQQTFNSTKLVSGGRGSITKDLKLNEMQKPFNKAWTGIKGEYQQTVEQVEDYVADPKLVEIKNRFTKGEQKII